MSTPIRIQKYDKYTVVEITTSSLMDPLVLDAMGKELYHMIDMEDRRQVILDFEKVQYISSQAIGILLQMKKKLDALPRSAFIVCSVGPSVLNLLKIVRLDRMLTIKKSQAEAVKQFQG